MRQRCVACIAAPVYAPRTDIKCWLTVRTCLVDLGSILVLSMPCVFKASELAQADTARYPFTGSLLPFVAMPGSRLPSPFSFWTHMVASPESRTLQQSMLRTWAPQPGSTVIPSAIQATIWAMVGPQTNVFIFKSAVGHPVLAAFDDEGVDHYFRSLVIPSLDSCTALRMHNAMYNSWNLLTFEGMEIFLDGVEEAMQQLHGVALELLFFPNAAVVEWVPF